MNAVPMLDDLDVSELRTEYVDRGLGSFSDSSLVSAVATVVTRPRQPPTDSFVLHAPLELAARAALLPLVAPDDRELARLHIVALAAQYQMVPAAELPEHGGMAAAHPGDLLAAIRGGDLAEVDAVAASVAAVRSSRQLVTDLADAVVPLSAAAAHAPIFLYHVSRAHPLAGVSSSLLRPLAQELAAQPGWRVRWFEDWKPASEGSSGRLGEALAASPLLGSPGSNFIHPLLMQVDESGVAASHLTPALGRYSDDAARAVLRVAAQSMLDDDSGHAPYGWSHCLTLPQAVLGLVGFSAAPDRLLAMAATHVLAFRAGLGQTAITPPSTVERSEIDPTRLAGRAATSHDAHIVKYVLACLDAAVFDPEARHLYYRAGQRLLDIWDENGGDPTDPLSP